MKIIKELIEAKKELEKEVKVADQLLAKIEMAEKRGGVLLLNDLDTGLIEKLQELTHDDNIIVMFTPDGSRIEIKHKDTNYSNKLGMVRKKKKNNGKE